MSGKTGIQWAERVWNPVVGCTRVSDGCRNCYAFQLHDQRHLAWKRGRWESAPPQYYEPFSRVQLLDERLTDPLHWRKPARVFVNSMSDLFHEDVPDEYIDRVFAVMNYANDHTYQVLTKRPDRMRAYINDPQTFHRVIAHVRRMDREIAGCSLPRGELAMSWPLPNVWLGTSVENQEAADKRIPELLACPAAVRFLSCEPLLGPVDLTAVNYEASHRARLTEALTGRDDEALSDILASMDPTLPEHEPFAANVLTGRWFDGWDETDGPRIDWVIVGGESGAHARPCDVGWIRGIVRQCEAAGVAVFCKQGGSSNACRHDRKGGHFECFPDDLQVREWPDGTRS